MLAQRVISGIVLAAVVAGALVVGGIPLDILVGLAAAIGAYEAGTILAALGARPVEWVLYPVAVLLALRFALPSGWHILEITVAGGLLLGMASAIVVRPSAPRWAGSLVAALYVGMVGYFLGLYLWTDAGASRRGLWLVVLALGGAILSDTAAYFVGSAIGRHRFFPEVSPKKSLEGALGGAIFCVGGAALVAPLLVPLSTAQAIGLGLVITVTAQAGDLAESALKREAGVKDSSGLIPGHGGLLDRLDSLLFVAPAVYCYLKVIAFP